MPILNKTYRVSDGLGRCWGEVRLEWAQNSSLHGRLSPEPGFDEVRPLFEQLESSMAVNGNEEQHAQIVRRIADLRVTLEDTVDGTTHDAGPVFVSSRLLFTCGDDT